MKKLLFLLLLSLSITAQAVKQDQSPPAVVAAVHEQIAQSGCWVKLYDEPQYRGNQLIIYDGQQLPTLLLGNGSDWRGNIRSMEVGPAASVVLYREEIFLHQEFSVESGVSLAGPWADTASLQLNCLKQNLGPGPDSNTN